MDLLTKGDCLSHDSYARTRTRRRQIKGEDRGCNATVGRAVSPAPHHLIIVLNPVHGTILPVTNTYGHVYLIDHAPALVTSHFQSTKDITTNTTPLCQSMAYPCNNHPRQYLTDQRSSLDAVPIPMQYPVSELSYELSIM